MAKAEYRRAGACDYKFVARGVQWLCYIKNQITGEFEFVEILPDRELSYFKLRNLREKNAKEVSRG